MRNIAPATTRNTHFGEQLTCFFDYAYVRFGIRQSRMNGGEKSRRTTTNHNDFQNKKYKKLEINFILTMLNSFFTSTSILILLTRT
jgi:hypothetical protein